MTINEYLIYAIKNGLLNKLQWYFSVLAIPGSDPYEDDFITYSNYIFKVKVDGDLIDMGSARNTLLSIEDKVKITHDVMSNVETEIDTTIGRVIVNYLLGYNVFKDKIKFINDKLDSSTFENKIRDGLVDGTITVDEYIKFVDSAGFISNLSRIVTIAATEKNIVAAPGIEEYKKKLIKEYNEQYGEGWMKLAKPVAEFDAMITKFDDNYLKDDPTYGKLMSGKVKNTGRHKMLISYGNETSFNDKDDANLITGSLVNGWPKQEKQLAAIFNSTRSASYSRSKETAEGGVLAKTFLRTTSSYRVSDLEDCGTKKGKQLLVTDYNKKNLLDKFMIVNGKTIPIKDIDSLVGKVITVRTPAYCVEKGSKFCQTCSGKILTLNKDAIPLMMIEVGAVILKLSLKKMHVGNTVDIVNIDLANLLK